MTISLKALLKETLVTVLSGSVVCGGVLLYKSFQRPQNVFPLREGDSVALLGYPFSKHPRTLLLATSPDCQFCIASAAFHAKLVVSARAANVPMLVLVQDLARDKVRLSDYGIPGVEFREANFYKLHIGGTPTLYAVDAHGQVVRAWVGQLSTAEENDVLESLSEKNPLPREIAADELPVLAKRVDISYVDLSPRDVPFVETHGWTRIPYDELEARAPFELPNVHDVVLDCGNVSREKCDVCRAFLVSHRVRNVATVDRGRKSPYVRDNCKR